MTRRARPIVAAVAGVLLLAILIVASTDLPRFGSGHSAYADGMIRASIGGRNVSNVVTAIVYDVRGCDSLGEEMILFGSVSGVILLLAEKKKGSQSTRGFAVTSFVRTSSIPLFALLVIFAVYLCWNGHLGMGGGFQGGVAGFGAYLLVYFARDLQHAERFAKISALEFLAAIGGGTFIVVGLVGLMTGGSFLWNWMPFGKFGALFSGGTIPYISIGVGIEVAAGFSILVEQFAFQIDSDRK